MEMRRLMGKRRRGEDGEAVEQILWKRLRYLGRGGNSFVSLASVVVDSTANNIPSTIAVKSAPYSESWPLQREFDFLRKLEPCPYIIRCFGTDTTNEEGNMFRNVLLEYASGGSLAEHVGSLSELEIKRHSRSILLGLVHVHEKGLVHCDVKPENVLLVGKDAKLVDFGLAKMIGEKTGYNGLWGTCLYAAPELFVGPDQHGPESDIWAFGCTVYELLTGSSIWSSGGVLSSTLSTEARDFLTKCLIQNPTLRWTTRMLLDHPFISSSSFRAIQSRHDLPRRVLHITRVDHKPSVCRPNKVTLKQVDGMAGSEDTLL